VFGDPVAGTIHPLSWQRPPGNRDFKVTSPFGPRGGGFHYGLDLGNGREGEPVYAQASGTVVEWRPVLDGVVTIQTDDARWRLVAAHMRDFKVRNGARVERGQVIGAVGSVGAPGQPHLHIENLQRGLMPGTWTPRDPWPLLDQEESMTIVTLTPFPEGTRTWTANTTKEYVGYKPDGTTKKSRLEGGSQAQASGTATIQQDPLKAPNGSGFVLIVNGVFAGYYMVRTDGTVAEPPAPPSTAQARKEGAQAAANAAQAVADALP
jgi:hypothetical protein